MYQFKSNDIDNSGPKQPVEESVTLTIKPADTWNSKWQLCLTKQTGCRVKYSASSPGLALCLAAT